MLFWHGDEKTKYFLNRSEKTKYFFYRREKTKYFWTQRWEDQILILSSLSWFKILNVSTALLLSERPKYYSKRVLSTSWGYNQTESTGNTSNVWPIKITIKQNQQDGPEFFSPWTLSNRINITYQQFSGTWDYNQTEPRGYTNNVQPLETTIKQNQEAIPTMFNHLRLQSNRTKRLYQQCSTTWDYNQTEPRGYTNNVQPFETTIKQNHEATPTMFNQLRLQSNTNNGDVCAALPPDWQCKPTIFAGDVRLQPVPVGVPHKPRRGVQHHVRFWKHKTLHHSHCVVCTIMSDSENTTHYTIVIVWCAPSCQILKTPNITP